MRRASLSMAAILLMSSLSTGRAAQITGEYIEARTCDVYTGPCFANAEMDLAGKEALIAWKVDEGGWQGVPLDGLTVALVINSQWTLGDTGVFPMRKGKLRSVILVDKRATPRQYSALVAFVKETAKEVAGTVINVRRTAMKFRNNYTTGRGLFTAGKLARIRTRAMKDSDCICTNEIVYYQPLTQVDNFAPVYSETLSYQGNELNNTWTTNNIRSAFLATFRR